MTHDDVFFHLMSSLQSSELTADVLERAYKSSYFPMADEAGFIAWHSPDPRAIFPLASLEFSGSLQKLMRKNNFEIRINTAFEDVVRACSRRELGQPENVWISDEIVDAYTELHFLGHAHSVETWYDGGLVGGLYGVSYGAAFFGESMFSRMSNASKIAFASLVQRLRERGFMLLDSQYANAFTLQLGAVEVPRSVYLNILDEALAVESEFTAST